ncbi:hypothetical protein DWB68_00005 [Galactobacter valiniphilus]|uniref:Uncharacterized protein n=1 Tax=Galactobacter valiniphilus TaxID=2676122 RepID=A0A399JEL8_9MICC|nr:hypothetical protein DWB68_00005 [Galactobacter valiniphilus]
MVPERGEPVTAKQPLAREILLPNLSPHRYRQVLVKHYSLMHGAEFYSLHHATKNCLVSLALSAKFHIYGETSDEQLSILAPPGGVEVTLDGKLDKGSELSAVIAELHSPFQIRSPRGAAAYVVLHRKFMGIWVRPLTDSEFVARRLLWICAGKASQILDVLPAQLMPVEHDAGHGCSPWRDAPER